jgi:hypothetical protein
MSTKSSKIITKHALSLSAVKLSIAKSRHLGVPARRETVFRKTKPILTIKNKG